VLQFVTPSSALGVGGGPGGTALHEVFHRSLRLRLLLMASERQAHDEEQPPHLSAGLHHDL
jgi:hypothetical protein